MCYYSGCPEATVEAMRGRSRQEGRVRAEYEGDRRGSKASGSGWSDSEEELSKATVPMAVEGVV